MAANSSFMVDRREIEFVLFVVGGPLTFVVTPMRI